MVTISFLMGTLSLEEVFSMPIAEPSNSPVLVYDVGGSHVAAAACVGDDFRLGPVVNAAHPAEAACDAFIGMLYKLGVEATNGFSHATGAVLAVPGPFDFEAGVSLMRHKLPYLYGIDLRLAIAERFGWKPLQVRFLNDADAYLLGEVGAGAARGFSRAIGLTLGTGIGSAFAVQGRLVSDGAGVPNGGEIWNLPYAGKTVEDFISTRAVIGNYQRRTGKSREVADLAAAASSDPAAAEAFVEMGQHLGRVIDSLLQAFAPEVVVLGGGISRSAHLFLPAARGEIRNAALKLRVSELGDRAALVGCGVAAFHGGNGSAMTSASGAAQNRAQ